MRIAESGDKGEARLDEDTDVLVHSPVRTPLICS